MGFTGALGCPGSCKLDLQQFAVDMVLVDGSSRVAKDVKEGGLVERVVSSIRSTQLLMSTETLYVRHESLYAQS